MKCLKIQIKSGLLGLGALLIASQVNAATVSLSPSAASVVEGDAFVLTVQGTEFNNDTAGGSIIVTWDTAAVTMTSTIADITASAALNGFPVDFFSTLTPGSLSATYSTFGTVSGPTFDFLSMDFTANSVIGSTLVDISAGVGGDWLDGSGAPITGVVYNDATVTVSAVPVPAAAWLFASGLIGLVGVARRKTQLA